jgi:CTD kinase subunit beta
MMARTQREEQRDEQRNPGPEPGPSNPNLPLIHPSFTQVTRPFVLEVTIQACFDAMGMDRTREEHLRLMGVNWIHSVRKALHLYVEWSCLRATSDEMLIMYAVRYELSTLR